MICACTDNEPKDKRKLQIAALIFKGIFKALTLFNPCVISNKPFKILWLILLSGKTLSIIVVKTMKVVIVPRISNNDSIDSFMDDVKAKPNLSGFLEIMLFLEEEIL